MIGLAENIWANKKQLIFIKAAVVNATAAFFVQL